MKLSAAILSVLLFPVILFSCKDFEDPTGHNGTFRIKKIREYNSLGETVQTISFVYDGERVVLWHYHTVNSQGNLELSRKVQVDYDGNTVSAALFSMDNNSWERVQECTFTVYNERVHEKSMSRYSFPECVDCWRYLYTYSGKNLVEWEKQLKTADKTWEKNRRVEYIYENGKLVEYRDFENYDHTGLKLDYRRVYFYDRDKISEWQGGTCTDISNWKPTQKVGYKYEQNKVVVKTYCVWDLSAEAWKNFGYINYFYDEDDNLVKESTSSGSRTEYEYEPGIGNTLLIYCDPQDRDYPEPLLKSSTIF